MTDEILAEFRIWFAQHGHQLTEIDADTVAATAFAAGWWLCARRSLENARRG